MTNSNNNENIIAKYSQKRICSKNFGMPCFNFSLSLIGLCIFTFVIISYQISIGYIGIIIGVIGLFSSKNKIILPFPVWFFLAFLLWSFLASFASSYQEITHLQLLETLKLLIILVITVNALRTEGQLRFFLIFALSCFILYPVRGALINYYFTGYNVFGRAIWNYIFENPNDLAALSLLALGIGFALRMSAPKKNLVRFGAGISTILLLWVILLTQSRGAFLGLGVFIMTLLHRTYKLSKGKFFGLIALLVIISISVPNSVWDRLSGLRLLTSTSTFREADWEGSAAQRFEIQKVAWRIFLDHKFFGVGLGAYNAANARYAPHLGARDTHNTYLNLAAEIGLPGLMLWCTFIFTVLRYAHRMQGSAGANKLLEQQRWIWWGFVAFLVSGLFATYSHLTFPIVMLAVLWCSGKILASSESYPVNTAQSGRP